MNSPISILFFKLTALSYFKQETYKIIDTKKSAKSFKKGFRALFILMNTYKEIAPVIKATIIITVHVPKAHFIINF